MDVCLDVSAINPKKRDRTVFESDNSNASLRLLEETSDKDFLKRQRFGNYSVTEVDQVYERVLLWLAANSDRLPKTLRELGNVIQRVSSLKAKVDSECVFYHLMLNGFLRVSDCDNDHHHQVTNNNNNHPHVSFIPPSTSHSSSNFSAASANSRRSFANNNRCDSLKISVNPFPANFEGSFLIVSSDAGPNSLSSSFRVSQDFVIALNKAVTWLRSSLQLPTTKRGFTSALDKLCVLSFQCPSSLIIEHLIRRGIISVNLHGSLFFLTLYATKRYRPPDNIACYHTPRHHSINPSEQ